MGVHADVSRRFGPEQRLGVRVNGVLSGGETWLDHQTKRREIGHLALDYQGSGWKAELDAYSLTNKVRKGSPMQPVITGWTTVPAHPMAPPTSSTAKGCIAIRKPRASSPGER